MKTFLRLLACHLLILAPAIGQNYSSQDFRLQLANLTQDVRLMNRNLGALQVELEQLKRENAQLKNSLVSQKALTDAVNEMKVSLNANVAALRKDFETADEKQKEAIVREVSKQITDLAKQMQETLDSFGDFAGFQGSGTPAIQFSDDFPPNGVAYEVQRGDTLSGIAKKFGSSVRDIQNANRIAQPQNLKAGDTIFVPIPE